MSVDAGRDAGVRPDASVPPVTGYTQTKYPIVLVHGMGGFDKLFGVLDYFYDIPNQLRAGGARVYVTQSGAIDSSEVRGEQIITQIENILAVTGAQKVNLIGHSQGGPDTRYVAAVRPDLIASVTTVAGVNKGSAVADFVIKIPGPIQYVLIGALGQFVEVISGFSSPQDGRASMQQLSTSYMKTWNQTYPAGVPTTACGEGDYVVNGIHYFSWSGASILTNALDVTDAMVAVTSVFFGSTPNDGLVGKCSSHLGQVIRDDYQQNHFDEVNQLLGLISPSTTSPPTLFRAHANRLKLLGL